MSFSVTLSWRDLPCPHRGGWEEGEGLCATVLVPAWMWGLGTVCGAGMGARAE